MQNKLFRREALERLSSPEQLDQLMRVTSPQAWLILLGMFIIIAIGVVWGVFGTIPTTASGDGILLRGRVDTIAAPEAGRIVDIYVKVGDQVEQGQVISRIIRENSDENVRIESPSNGRIIELRVSSGDFVETGESILNLEPSGDDVKDLEAVLYLPASEGTKVQAGMRVQIVPATVRAEETGVVLGVVTSVGEFPESQESMRRVLQNEDLVDLFFESTDRAPIEIRVDLIPSRDTASGYKWSSPDGQSILLQSGTLFQGTIILDEKSPLRVIFPFLG